MGRKKRSMRSASETELASEIENSANWSSLAEHEVDARMHDFTSSLHEDIKHQLLIKRLKRDFRRQLAEFVLYICFLTLFSVVMLGVRDPLYSFQYNELTKDLVLEEEFPESETEIYKSFHDVATFEEFWQFMNGVLVPAIFSDQGGFGPGFLYGQNYLVGTMRVRQVRIRPASCPALELPFHQVYRVEDCLGSYADSRVSKESFGPPSDPTKYSYSPATELKNARRVIARLQWYEGGGFVKEFSAADSEDFNTAAMAELQEDNFVDLRTRAIFVDFTTYNGNVNLFSNAQLAFEFLPSGGVFPSSTMRTLRLYKYRDTHSGRAQLAFEIILAAFVLFYVGSELYEITQVGFCAYLRNPWNYLDWVNNTLFLAAFVLRGIIITKLDDLDLVASNQRTFYNFNVLNTLNSSELNILSTNAFLLWFKIFKYTSFIPAMAMIAQTVAVSFKNTVGFIVVFTFVLFGFAQAGVLAFGVDVFDFRTFTDTFFTLLRAMLGDFDFEAMQYSNRAFGPIYFIFFMVLVFFIMLSLFLAILNDAYLNVQEDQRSKPAISVISVTRDWLKSKAAVFDTHHSTDVVDTIQAKDLKHSQLLTPDELLEVFKSHEKLIRHVLDMDAEELLAFFDVDRSGNISPAEQVALLHKLEDWRKDAEVLRQRALGEDDRLVATALEELEKNANVSVYIVSIKHALATVSKTMTHMEDSVENLRADVGVEDKAWRNEAERAERDAHRLRAKQRSSFLKNNLPSGR